MSESNENLVDGSNNEAPQENSKEASSNEVSQIETSSDSVSYDSHKKAIGQLKNSQKRERELSERLADLETDRDNEVKSRLEEKQEYKKLYENQVSQNSKILAEIAEKEKALVNDHKRRALEEELGGLKKSQYFKFANLDDIVISDDGTVDQNSVKFEANRYRQEFPELINQTKTVILNNQAPSNDGIVNKQKSASEMSTDERAEFVRNNLRKK